MAITKIYVYIYILFLCICFFDFYTVYGRAMQKLPDFCLFFGRFFHKSVFLRS